MTALPTASQFNVSTVTEAQFKTALAQLLTYLQENDGKFLPLYGGNLSGNLIVDATLFIRSVNPVLVLQDTDNGTAGYVVKDNTWVGFLGSDGSWGLAVDEDHTVRTWGPIYVGTGGTILSTDGNLYMTWAGDWLSNVLARKMGLDMNYNNNGSMCFAANISTSITVNPGETISGTNLRASNVQSYTGSSLPGTWRCLGFAYKSGGQVYPTLWQRVA